MLYWGVCMIWLSLTGILIKRYFSIAFLCYVFLSQMLRGPIMLQWCMFSIHYRLVLSEVWMFGKGVHTCHHKVHVLARLHTNTALDTLIWNEGTYFMVHTNINGFQPHIFNCIPLGFFLFMDVLRLQNNEICLWCVEGTASYRVSNIAAKMVGSER